MSRNYIAHKVHCRRRLRNTASVARLVHSAGPARAGPTPVMTDSPVVTATDRRLACLVGARTESAVAGGVDDPPRQPPSAEARRAEGRRPPGIVGIGRDADDGAVLRRPSPGRSRRGQAARESGVSRHSVPARPADRRKTSRRSAPRVALSRIRRAPRTPTTSIFRPGRWGSAWR